MSNRQLYLNHLRHFVVVARELHFGRAAEKLHIAQPPLSHQIKHLEKDLGVELFERKHRRIRLTKAGEVFLSGIERVLADLDQSVALAQRAHRGEFGVLNIGTIPNGLNNLFTRVLPEFKKRNMGLQLRIRSLETAQQVEALLNGDIDLGIVRLPLSDSRIVVAHSWSDELLVAMAKDHALAQHQEVLLSDLRGERFVMFPRKAAPEYFDYIRSAVEASGGVLDVFQETEDMSSQFALVAAAFGVALIPASIQFTHEDVVYVPLKEERLQIATGLAFVPERLAHSAEQFILLLDDLRT